MRRRNHKKSLEGMKERERKKCWGVGDTGVNEKGRPALGGSETGAV